MSLENAEEEIEVPEAEETEEEQEQEPMAANIEEMLLREDSIDGGIDSSADTEDPEIEAIKARVKEMEEEAEKLKEMQKSAEESLLMGSPTNQATLLTSPGDKGDTDARSVYVGNVDYSATATDLEQHFHGCGAVNRVTILCDRYTGNPKGFAYVEFTEKDSVETACQLTDSLFKGRQIKVTAKRTNVPGISTTNRYPRARYRGRGRGGFGGYGGYGGSGFAPRGRGRGGFRARRANWFSPY